MPPATENQYVRKALLFPAVFAIGLLSLLPGCSGKKHFPNAPAPAPRSYRMGFSAIPPRPDLAQALAAIDLWTRRADAAILHFDPPWDTLLKGAPIDSAVILVHKPLVDYYRAKGLMVVVTLDATNGLDRGAESPALVAAGRSLTEPAIQQIYRDYAVAVDTLLRPSYFFLAAETNLIRAAGRTPVPVPEIVLKLAFGRFGLPALPPGAVAHLKYPVVIDDSSFRTATGYNNKYDEDQTIAAFRSVAG